MTAEMHRTATLPFELTREEHVVGESLTTTTHTIHGLLHLGGDRIRVQWRIAREVVQVGAEIRTDRELERVTEAEIPLAAMVGAEVRSRWWSRLGFPGGLQFVLRAADLRAFDSVAGAGAMELEHPSELTIPLRRADLLAAREFAAELAMALAERQLPGASDGRVSAPLGLNQLSSP